MDDDEREAAVKAHLQALDAEIARLRKLGEAMDRKLAEREPAHEDGGKPDEGPPPPARPS